MDWFKSIKGWYNNGDGFWTKEMVADAVRYGKITLAKDGKRWVRMDLNFRREDVEITEINESEAV